MNAVRMLKAVSHEGAYLASFSVVTKVPFIANLSAKKMEPLQVIELQMSTMFTATCDSGK